MKNSHYLYLDFEFHPSPYRWIDVFCGASWFAGQSLKWDTLYDGESLIDYIVRLPRPLTLVAYGLDSELRCLASLTGLDRPRLFTNYICLHREFKLLCNRNKEMVYGDVVSKKGKINRKFTGGQSSDGNEDKKYIHLLNALFKVCGEYNEEHVRSKEIYTQMCAKRELSRIRENIEGLKEYCAMDTEKLPALLQGIWEYHQQRHPYFDKTRLLSQMRKRGSYAELIAYKTQKGYHVDSQATVNLITNAPAIANSIAQHILRTWPHKKTFSWSEKDGRYTQHADVIRHYIQHEAPPHIRAKFKKTKEGAYSLSKDTFEELYPNRHSLDLNDYLQQVYRYRYTFDALKGLTLWRQSDESKTKKFGDYYDEREGVVRPQFNDFGSQTSRNQPKSNGYLLLKPAWMRNLLKPPPGHCMMVSDIGQEEVLILAVLSGDMALLEDYRNGVYTSYGYRTGAFKNAQEGTNEWKIIRQAIKQLILGIMYGKGQNALAIDLTEITGRVVHPSQAKRDIQTFWRTYPLARRFVENTWNNYRRDGVAVLGSGWTMWGANFNRRSVVNYPMQGFGAETMREVDFELDNMGLWSPLSLHDAFAVYSPLDANGLPDLETAAKLTVAIRRGFAKALQGRPGVECVKNDMKIILPNYKKGEMVLPGQILVENLPVNIQYDSEYNDERAGVDLDAFGKFFKPQLEVAY